MATVIAKNIGVVDVGLEDLGLIIPVSSIINLTDTYELYEITASNDLKNKVSAEIISIGDGVGFLCKEDGLKHISIETEYEDLKSGSICQIYDYSGITNCNASSGVVFPFDAESFKDPNYTHSNTTNPEVITVNSNGVYKIYYSISHISQNSVRKNVRVFCVINDSVMINPSLSYSYSRNIIDRYATNSALFLVPILNEGDYITLVCERAGSYGVALSEAEGCWLMIEKVRGI